MIIAVLLAVVSAVLQSLSNVIQHKAVFSGGGAHHVTMSGTAGLLKNKLWIAGFGVMVVAFGFQAVALGVGRLVVVQTVLVSMLVWVLLFAVFIEKIKLTALEYRGSALVIVGLVLFVIFVSPTAGARVVDFHGWAIAFVVVVAVCFGLAGIGKKLSSGPAAALMGAAGGLSNGLNGAMTTASINLLVTHGAGALASSWLLYATIVALLLGVLFPVWAFQAGPVTASIPPLVVFNPALATVLGVLLLDQKLHESAGDIVMIAVAWALMLAGIFVLSRSKVIAEEFAEQ